MNHTDLILQAYEIADEIKKSQEYLEYKKALVYFEENYQTEIEELNEVKDKISTLNSYDPSYKEYKEKYLKIKEKFLLNQDYLHYQKKEQELNEYIGKINRYIYETLKLENEFINEYGFLEKGRD